MKGDPLSPELGSPFMSIPTLSKVLETFDVLEGI